MCSWLELGMARRYWLFVAPRTYAPRHVGRPKLDRLIDDGKLDAQDERLLTAGSGREDD